MSVLSTVAARTEADLEFDRQVDALVVSGVPELVDFREDTFRAALEPLRDLLPTLPSGSTGIPFVIVVPAAPAPEMLAAVSTADGTGFTTMTADDLAAFRPLPELELPNTPYLLLDVDTGADTLDVAPREALERISGTGRIPITFAEGLALLVGAPGILRSRNSFCLLGSRAGDERVLALWDNGLRPRLGWTDEGTGHSWLGSASCAGRLAPVARLL